MSLYKYIDDKIMELDHIVTFSPSFSPTEKDFLQQQKRLSEEAYLSDKVFLL